ncbi:hypothetical protein [Microbacterium sp. AK031]|uniref:DUF7169 domain-containing protein n=1 Tax=Microbacterium sp. AK031 TaxID=2723076 RepID=UPI00216994C9|nr:hypothetical protein [Microbacterium sp. AK031]MCS3844803.1 hypothetical protein [Microbacterium sp. AK031]
MSANDSSLATLERFGAVTLRLRSLLADTAEAQFQASRHPVDPEETGIRSIGLYNDPTYQITVDRGRRELRKAVKGAERALALAAQTMRAAEHKLAEALSPGQ